MDPTTNDHKPDFSRGVKSKAEAGLFLGVSSRTIDQLAVEGLIERYSLRGKTVFSTVELIEYLEATCQRGGAGLRKKTVDV